MDITSNGASAHKCHQDAVCLPSEALSLMKQWLSQMTAGDYSLFNFSILRDKKLSLESQSLLKPSPIDSHR